MLIAPEKLYICPGESQPISRAVHLARLAAGYSACCDCPHRIETGHLAIKPKTQSVGPTRTTRSLFTSEGVRGIHRNELTRTLAGELAAALATLLWEDAPLLVRKEPARSTGRRLGPAVVVGWDERPSSPDLATGVSDSLRRMGCQVVEIGITSRPCFWFSVDHLHAAGGIFVTGAGCPPAWTGLDFALRGGSPVSQLENCEPIAAEKATTGATPTVSAASGLPLPDGRLVQYDMRRIADRFKAGCDRPTRHGGGTRVFRADIPYEAGLVKHFHALRPLTVCCGTPSRLLRRRLERLFAPLPCRLICVPLPLRTRDLCPPEEPDLLVVGNHVREAGADLGVVIDDDGQRCAFLDEEGNFAPPEAAAALFAHLIIQEQPAAVLVGENAEGVERLTQSARGTKAICLLGGPTLAEMSWTMRIHQAAFGAGPSGYYWFRESLPACDAILTVARMLAALSQRDAAFSAVVRELDRA